MAAESHRGIRDHSEAKSTIEALENPATGATLEAAWSSATSYDEDLYQSLTYANTIPPNPYPGCWFPDWVSFRALLTRKDTR